MRAPAQGVVPPLADPSARCYAGAGSSWTRWLADPPVRRWCSRRARDAAISPSAAFRPSKPVVDVDLPGLREQAQDLPLPRRDLPGRLRVRLAARPAHHGARGTRVERALTPVDGADRPEEFGEVHVLHDVALRALPDGLADQPLVRERRQHQDPALRKAVYDLG